MGAPSLTITLFWQEKALSGQSGAQEKKNQPFSIFGKFPLSTYYVPDTVGGAPQRLLPLLSIIHGLGPTSFGTHRPQLG